MTSKHTNQVWTSSKAKGSHKLVLLALADHADRSGQSSLSQRDISNLCCLSKSRVDEIIRSLVDAGELRVIDHGAGRGNPATYWITPPEKARNCPEPPAPVVAPPKVKPVTDDLHGALKAGPGPVTTEPHELTFAVQAPPGKQQPPTDMVQRVLTAAGIEHHPDQPFFWFRTEHKTDLTAALESTGKSLDRLCAELRDAVADGAKLDRPARRISDILGLIGLRT